MSHAPSPGCLTDTELAAFLSGALDPTSISRLEAHLDTCPDCRALLAAVARDSDAPHPMFDPLRQLAVGQTIAGRYRVVRFIGAGGMGEVYEADDTTLGVRVALKTVHPDRADDPTAVSRLKRELTVARQVTHPNVSRVFDVGEHLDADGTVLTFFTLELLDGETLAEALQRNGPLPLADARRLLEQIASGLDAAHAAGVLHRDLKSHNVFLRRVGGRVDAVLTDFGLARSSRLDPASHLTGGAAGTPAYMSPEQVMGSAITEASDLFALGVVAFEMVTGTLPFRADDPIAAATARLHTPAPDPRSLAPGLPPGWSRLIAALLERDPGNRPPRASAALSLLEHHPRWSTRRRRRALALGALAVVTAALTVAGLRLLPRTPAPASTSPGESARRRVLAVLPFDDLSDPAQRAAWLAPAVAQMLSTTLAASPDLRPVSTERLALAASELGLDGARELTSAQLDALRHAVDVDLVVVGTVTSVGGERERRIRFDASVYDAALGKKVRAASEHTIETGLFEAIERVSDSLLGALAVQPPSTLEKRAQRAALPSTPDGERAYAEGTRALATLDVVRARDRLEAATMLEPDFAPAQAALAQTLMALGRREDAAVVAKQAFTHANGLSREQQLDIEALYRTTQREWPRAIELYRALWNVYPDVLDHGLKLAQAQFAAGQLTESQATVEQLRRHAPGDREDPRVELAAAAVALRVPDAAAAEVAARKADTLAGLQSSRVMQARARSALAEALVYLGRRDEALTVLTDAEQIFRVVGDQLGVLRATVSRGNVLRDRGSFPEALTQYEAAEKMALKLGDERARGSALIQQAVVWRRQGQPEKALALNEAALVLLRANHDRANECVVLNNLGRVLEDLGRPDDAMARYREAVALADEVGDVGIKSRSLGSLGLIAADRGDLAAGRQAFEALVQTIPSTGDAVLQAKALQMLIDIEVLQGDAAAADARMREHDALSASKKLEDDVERGQTRATIALLKRDFAAAEKLARQSAEAWQARKSPADEVEARRLVFSAVLAEKQKPQAQAELARVQQLAATESKGPAKGTAESMQARFDAELGDAKAGAQSLGALLRREGLTVADRFELELSLAQAHGRSGGRAVALRELTDVGARAHRQGFGGVEAAAGQLQRELTAAR